MTIADHLRRYQPDIYARLMELASWPDLHEVEEEELEELAALMKEKPRRDDGK